MWMRIKIIANNGIKERMQKKRKKERTKWKTLTRERKMFNEIYTTVKKESKKGKKLYNEMYATVKKEREG